MNGFSSVLKQAIDRFCDDSGMSYEKLGSLLSLPTMTLRRYGYDTEIWEPGTGEKIKNPNHIHFPSQYLGKLYELTNNKKLLEYFPQKYGGVVM